MTFTLGDNIKVGHKIKTINGWRRIKTVTDSGVIVKEGMIYFGKNIYGWKVS